jgi:5-methylcytosine-specific restriction protein A
VATPRKRGRVWERTRRYVLERDAYRCQLRHDGCTLVADQVDHIVPLSAGGAELDPRNLRASCGHCNASRGGKASMATIASYGRRRSRW